MEIPKTVSILGVPYEVAVGEMEDGEDGSISPRRQLIMLCEEKRAQVYLHEFVEFLISGSRQTDTNEGIGASGI
jgi:hypothetical protein